MSKGLEQFENRDDDWLAKERKEEDKVSAWDFDEGKKIKEFHADNCEAKEIKETHERIHAKMVTPRQIPSRNKASASGLFSIIFIIIGFNIVSSIFFEEELPFMAPLIIFVFIMIIISISKTKGKN